MEKNCDFDLIYCGPVTYEQVNGLQEDINFYISDNQEAEFEENELLYEEFDELMTAALKEDNR